MRIVDLSQELSNKVIFTLNQLDFHASKGKSRLLATHIEAPSYLVPNGNALNQYEPACFFRDAIVLDLTHMKSKQLINDEDLEAAEEAAGLAMREGEIAILHTGWEKYAETEDYWVKHPALSENGAQYLEFKRLVGVGVDTPNVDSPGERDLPVHCILMTGDLFILENLCNLYQIDRSRFRLIALPPRTKTSVSLVRALAILDDASVE